MTNHFPGQVNNFEGVITRFLSNSESYLNSTMPIVTHPDMRQEEIQSMMDSVI